MKIAICTLAAPWEGNPHFAVYNCHQATTLSAAGHPTEVFVLSPYIPAIFQRLHPKPYRLGGRPKEYEFQGVRFHSIKGLMPHPVWMRWHFSPHFPYLSAYLMNMTMRRRLLAALRRYQPDVLLVRDTILNGSLAIWLGKKLGVPVALIGHDVIDLPPESRLGRYYVNIAQQARVLFNVGYRSVMHIRDRMGLSNVRLASNGTIQATAEQRATPRPEHWRGKKVVLCVGSYIPRKGHADLLRAFAVGAPPEAILALVGDPPQPLKDLIHELKLYEQVEILPPMSQQGIQQYMVWADVFALPSWWEAFGLVYAEAMAAETPVIMTSDCGMSFHIQQGVQGWVIEPRDIAALTRVLRAALTEADLAAMGRAGRELVNQRMTWKHNAQILLAGLQGLPDPALMPTHRSVSSRPSRVKDDRAWKASLQPKAGVGNKCMRIAMCTLAAPWESNPTNSMYNCNQAAALCAAGHQTDIFVLAHYFPRWIQRLHPKIRGLGSRPYEYEFGGVRFHSIKGIMPHPVWMHWHVSPYLPRISAYVQSMTLRRKFLRALRRYRPDVLLVHDTIINGPLAMWAGKKLRVPVALIDHDAIDMQPDSRLGRHYIRLGRQAKVIFSVSFISCQHIRDELGLPHIRLTPNGTIQATPEQRTTPRPQRWRDKKVVLCVAAYRPPKGHGDLLRAFAAGAPPEAILAMVGEPPPPLKQFIREMGLEQRVEILPRTDAQGIQQYMVWADLFALPSWWEAYGLVFAEAMAAETPVIMTSDCGMSFHVDNGVQGWIVQPRNIPELTRVLRQALTDADLKTMGRAGRERVDQRISWARNAQLVAAGLKGEPDELALPKDLKLPPRHPWIAGDIDWEGSLHPPENVSQGLM